MDDPSTPKINPLTKHVSFVAKSSECHRGFPTRLCLFWIKNSMSLVTCMAPVPIISAVSSMASPADSTSAQSPAEMLGEIDSTAAKHGAHVFRCMHNTSEPSFKASTVHRPRRPSDVLEITAALGGID